MVLVSTWRTGVDYEMQFPHLRSILNPLRSNSATVRNVIGRKGVRPFSGITNDCSFPESYKKLVSLFEQKGHFDNKVIRNAFVRILMHRERSFEVVQNVFILLNHEIPEFDENGELATLLLIEQIFETGPEASIDNLHLLAESGNADCKLIPTFVYELLLLKAIEEGTTKTKLLLEFIHKYNIDIEPDYNSIIRSVFLPNLMWESIDEVILNHDIALETLLDIFDIVSQYENSATNKNGLISTLERWKVLGANIHSDSISNALETFMVKEGRSFTGSFLKQIESL